jgi:acyl dehydratase
VTKTYFEDLAVGEPILIGQWSISKSECVAFAEAWEPQPHHVSETAASSSLHGRLTVCSLYLFAICTRLFFDYERPLAVLAMLGKDEVVLPSPAYPGDRLSYWTRCIERRLSRSRPGTGVVTLEDTLSTDSGRIVLGQKVRLLVARRSP